MSLIGDYVLDRHASGARDEKYLRAADTPAVPRERRLDRSQDRRLTSDGEAEASHSETTGSEASGFVVV
jgi:hypothetical protein